VNIFCIACNIKKKKKFESGGWLHYTTLLLRRRKSDVTEKICATCGFLCKNFHLSTWLTGQTCRIHDYTHTTQHTSLLSPPLKQRLHIRFYITRFLWTNHYLRHFIIISPGQEQKNNCAPIQLSSVLSIQHNYTSCLLELHRARDFREHSISAKINLKLFMPSIFSWVAWIVYVFVLNIIFEREIQCQLVIS